VSQISSGSEDRIPAHRERADEARATKRKRALPLQAPDLRSHRLAQLCLGDLRGLGSGFELREP
jgi:hypothetical protein